MGSWFQKTAVVFLVMCIMACGKGFSSSSAPTSSTGSGNSGQSVPDGTVNPDLQQISYNGKQAQGTGAGRVLLELDKVNEAVILILPLPTEILAFIGAIPSMEIKDLPGSKVFFKDGKLAVSIPLKYIVRNGSFKQGRAQNLLPNGDPLPAFPAGEGAGFAIQITGKYKLHLYVGVSAAAVFIETPDWDKVLTCGNLPICPALGPWEIRNELGNEVLGYTAFVYAKSGYSSGAFVAATFPDSLARLIDDHLRY